MSLKLKVITGSTRPGRVGPTIAKWVAEAATAHGGFEVEAIDIADMQLPFLDEPNHPAMQDYQHDHTKAWSAKVADADAFLFLTPEYDSYPSAVLVNAVQVLLNEWKYKPAAVVSYGGVSGGLRAAQELRQLLSNVSMVAIPQGVPVPFFPQFIDENAVFKPNDPMTDGLTLVLDELAKWAEPLKALHAA
ncbi:NADPH-dependent FMN reductase [Psychromarinibacter sp. S121]|uniref:NADPH-dependent FMN reductase n=1 Tax=Psychromarinibacter sp. S121 TaxID=3415127 RepID=UPI003C7B2ECE